MKTRKRILSILLCAVMLCGVLPFSTSAANSIPDDAVEFNGHYYKVYDKTGYIWTAAKEYCENIGGHLVTITSQEEQNFIESEIANSKMKSFWTGALRVGSDWTWITGEEWNYTNWAKGEPNNDSSTEFYVHILISGKWNDTKLNMWPSDTNTTNSSFICEWDSFCVVAGRKFDANIDYYTTAWDSSMYNAKLANLTMALSHSVYNENSINMAYNSLGFSKSQFDLYDYDGDFDIKKCGYAMGIKKSIYNDDTICLIVVRGSSNTSDWVSNLTISTYFMDEKHTGFELPAREIYKNIKEKLPAGTDIKNIKFVITGHSRGAAVANLLEVKLMENGVIASNIYGYNFACPDVACKLKFPSYKNIFNLSNRADFVPLLPGSAASMFTGVGKSWGKFGITYRFTQPAYSYDPISGHDSFIYLYFFDQQLNPSEWDYTYGDALSDTDHWILEKLTKLVRIKVFCPVDVIIEDDTGTEIASVISGIADYHGNDFGKIIILTDGDKKIIYLSDDDKFNVNLIGTDNGEMTYSIEKYNMIDDEITESKTFSNVALESGKQMYSPVSEANTTNEIELFVVEKDDSSNNIIRTHTIDIDGKETLINANQDTSSSCNCSCHKSGIVNFFWKIINFFHRIFGMEQYHYCSCGNPHWK